MYCAFVTGVDFMKAFDTVWRAGLWHKMLLNNINGKMYDVIFNMYCNIKSCIVFNKCKSDYFACDNGIRQGENLSPFLFSLFLNDLETFLEAKNITGLESISNDLENQLNIYLKLFIIYADDTVILSESESDLQAQLDAFHKYCLTWKLKVNIDKTKIVIFGSGRTPQNLSFKYNGSEIEVVKNFNYLGIIFSKTGNFNLAKKRLVDKAVVSMYAVLKLGRKHNLSIKCLLSLFDKMVKPILLYGCEIWGFGNNDVLEKVHLKFCKMILNLKTSTPNYMIYGELGRYPVEIDIKIRIISFWAKLICGKQSKISCIMYSLSHHLYSQQNFDIKWIKCLKKRLNETGFSNIWQTQTFKSIEWLKQSIKQTLLDQFLQDWNSSVHNSPKAFNYRIFKTDFKFEEYFNILDEQNSLLLCKFRTTNHKLPIEKGRWSNIPRENRYCELCQKNQIGDEYHYIFECTNLSEKRTSLLPKHLIERPNIIKFKNLMTSERKPILQKLCKFIRYINMIVCPPG